jgi:hypothetical protein
MWKEEKWGTECASRYFGIFRVFVTRVPSRSLKSERWIGILFSGHGAGVTLTYRIHENAASAKYEALVELRNKLQKALAEVNQVLESEEEP